MPRPFPDEFRLRAALSPKTGDHTKRAGVTSPRFYDSRAAVICCCRSSAINRLRLPRLTQ